MGPVIGVAHGRARAESWIFAGPLASEKELPAPRTRSFAKFTEANMNIQNPASQNPIPMSDRSGEVPYHETEQLIASDKVEGTPVIRSDGQKVGRIENVMIDKRSGKVAYAVLGFGGFLGLGEKHYPLPWSLLSYNERLGGYEVNVTEEQLRGAPGYENGDEWDWGEYEKGRVVHNYYGLVPYWL
jgi:sporulation protein YlmC with PRC-barrel domain